MIKSFIERMIVRQNGDRKDNTDKLKLYQKLVQENKTLDIDSLEVNKETNSNFFNVA